MSNLDEKIKRENIQKFLKHSVLLRNLKLEGKEINIFPHSYRHSRAQSLKMGTDTRLLDKNGKPRKYSLEEIQKFCHHESSNTTQMYLKNHDEDLIDDMFGFNK